MGYSRWVLPLRLLPPPLFDFRISCMPPQNDGAELAVMWGSVMSQLGGEFRELALFPDDPPLVHEHCAELLETHNEALRQRIADALGEDPEDV